jgi:hypothetical protein
MRERERERLMPARTEDIENDGTGKTLHGKRKAIELDPA